MGRDGTPRPGYRDGVMSNSERVRRVTYWLIGGGVLIAWLGGAMSVIGEVSEGGFAPLHTLIAVVALVLFTVLYIRTVLAAVVGRGARREVVLAGLLALVVLITSSSGDTGGWGLIGPVWASVAVLGVSRAWAVAICAVTTVVCTLLTAPLSTWPLTLAYYALMCALAAWANRFQLWLWQVVRAAEEGREARARLAVTEERLRFARDLHDLVGHRLSAIAVKSELAGKLAAVADARAAGEIAEVRRLARESLRDIRAAVRGYRTLDLAAELRSVRAVLEADGVRCELDMPPADLPEDLGTLLAWVVREGTTNVLRHSAATRCAIGLTVRDGQVVLTMSNDGAGRGEGKPGSGLAGLAERVAALGGVLRAGPGEEGEFLLTATVPMGRTA